VPERELELRLHAVARSLDAPAFDVARLPATPRWRLRESLVPLLAAVAVLGAVAAPAAVSALGHLFEVDAVPELGPLAPGVAPPFAGRTIPVQDVQAWAPFRVRTISSLGAPEEARVRDDITGGMVTLVYDGARILLTQWRTTDVHPRLALVPASGKAEDVTVDGRPALWIEGTARGTFTLVGADGAVHRESFDASPGVLLWRDSELTYLLEGAAPKEAAVELASRVDP
jgi:hypothetical protein